MVSADPSVFGVHESTLPRSHHLLDNEAHLAIAESEGRIAICKWNIESVSSSSLNKNIACL